MTYEPTNHYHFRNQKPKKGRYSGEKVGKCRYFPHPPLSYLQFHLLFALPNIQSFTQSILQSLKKRWVNVGIFHTHHYQIRNSSSCLLVMASIAWPSLRKVGDIHCSPSLHSSLALRNHTRYEILMGFKKQTTKAPSDDAI
jgi:hypothetical protein